MSTAIAIDDTKQTLAQLAERAHSKHEEILLHKNGKTIARIVPEIEWPPPGESGLRAEETRLYQTINRSLTDLEWTRYKRLLPKLEDETLTPREHRELIRLVDKIEKLHSERLLAIEKLGRIQKVPFRSLLNRLGIQMQSPNPQANG